MIKTNAISLFALACAAGCTFLPSVGPDYKAPDYEPEAFRLPDAGQPTTNLTETCEYAAAAEGDDTREPVTTNSVSRWWERFDDPVLTDLMKSAVTNNAGFKMTLSRLDQANWELLGSKAAYWPKVDFAGALDRNWNYANTMSGAGRHRDFTLLRGAFDAAWEIDIFGGSRREVEAAVAQAQAAGWGAADAWLSLSAQIAAQYVNLRTTQQRIEVARTNLVLQSETYDILKSRLDSGIGDELAVNQCAYVVEQTRARIPQLLAQEVALKNALAVLAGAMPGALDEALKPVPERRDWLLAPQKVAELPLDLMRSRPDVKQAERNLAAQTARIGVAKAQWFPRLFVSGSVGLESSPKPRKLFEKESFVASLGPSVSWPIFQGGAIYASVKAAEARTEEMARAYELALETAYGEVRDAYAAYTQEQHRYQALAGAVRAATDAVAISKDLYKNGLKDFNNVLDAQRSRLQLEEEFVLSRGQITLNLIGLYKALGGGLVYPQADDKEGAR